MPYPWNEGDTLTAADLNDAVAHYVTRFLDRADRYR